MSNDPIPNEGSGTGETAPADDSASSVDSTSVEQLRQERDELRSQLLRLAAEFDNYRKRTERERREQIELAAADLARDLLPIIDDLERAIDAAVATDADDPRLTSLRTGVEMVYKQFLDTLRKRNIEPIDAVGAQFDPEWHEAVATEPAGDRADGEVVGEIRRGYRIGERLLRAALVRVAKA